MVIKMGCDRECRRSMVAKSGGSQQLTTVEEICGGDKWWRASSRTKTHLSAFCATEIKEYSANNMQVARQTAGYANAQELT